MKIKNNLLVEEITRLHSLMNVKGNIISEQLLPTILKNSLVGMEKKAILSLAKKEFRNEISTQIGKRTMSSLSDDAILNIITHLDFDKLAIKLTNEIPALMYQQRVPFYKTFLRELKSAINKSDKYLEIQNNMLNLGKPNNPPGFMERLTQNNSDLIKQIDKGLNKIFLNDFETYIFNNDKNLWKEIENVATSLPEKKIKNEISKWGQVLKGNKLTPKEIVLLTDDLWFRYVRTLIYDVTLPILKTEDALYQRLGELLERAVKDAERGVVKRDLYKGIDVYFENIIKTKNESKDLLWSSIQRELQNRGIPFEKISTVMQNMKKHQANLDYPEWMDEFIDKSYLIKIFKPGPITIGRKARNFLERTFNTLGLGNPRTYNEYYNEFIKGGGRFKWPLGLLKIYGYLQFLDKVFFPLVEAALAVIYIPFTKYSKKYPMPAWDRFKTVFKEKITLEFVNSEKYFKSGVKEVEWGKTMNPLHSWFEKFISILDRGNEGELIEYIDNGRDTVRNIIATDTTLQQIRQDIEQRQRSLDSSRLQLQQQTLGGKEGFKGFLTLKRYDLKSSKWCPDYEVGFTNDGKAWTYNATKNEWNEFPDAVQDPNYCDGNEVSIE